MVIGVVVGVVALVVLVALVRSVKIVRENLDGTKKIIPIDVNRVESEKRVHAKEFLKPGDTIFVPQRLF